MLPDKRAAQLIIKRKIAFLVFTVTTVWVFLGYLYQNKKTAQDLKTYTPPGKTVEIKDVQYHLYCTGEGNPTVVLEAGWGENSLSWYLVQNKVSRRTRVCSYDRAGLGWSSGAGAPLSVDEVAEHLLLLLHKGAVPPPYVLVGHSRGGIFVRKFYEKYRNKVSGMILVDSTHEQGPLRTHRFQKVGYLKQYFQSAIAVPLSKIGFIRIMGWLDADSESNPLPKYIIEAKNALQNSSKTIEAAVNEIRIMRSERYHTMTPPNLHNLPLIVLSVENNNTRKKTELDTIFNQLQTELVGLSSNAQHVLTGRSGHYMMYDQPELIVQSILAIVDFTKCKTGECRIQDINRNIR